MTTTIDSVIHDSRQAVPQLRSTPADLRSRGITLMAKLIEAHRDDILEANTLDLEASREMAVPALILDWLKLTPERLTAAVQILERLAHCPDPLNQASAPPHAASQGLVIAQSMPLGVVALIYESFPELSAIMAGFSLRTGNALIIKGGSEASHSNRAIVKVLQEALQEAKLPKHTVQLLPSDQGNLVRELVTVTRGVNLVIPYGRRSLVNQVAAQATVPVLKTAIGNCYLYWGSSGSAELVNRIVVDSHKSEPDPVNAVEKVLIDQRCDDRHTRELIDNLASKGFKLKGDAVMVAKFPELALADEEAWTQASLNRTVTFKTVENVEQAAQWVNSHSSGHADCLVTDSYSESRRFATAITSATVYVNTSPRFSRIPSQGYPLFLGMSNDRGHYRGPITLGMLTTLKQVMQGPV